MNDQTPEVIKENPCMISFPQKRTSQQPGSSNGIGGKCVFQQMDDQTNKQTNKQTNTQTTNPESNEGIIKLGKP